MKAHPLRTAVSAALGALLAKACTPAPQPSDPHPQAPTSEYVTFQPSAQTSTSVLVGAPPPSSAPPAELGPRRGAAGATQGTIACGTSRCVASRASCGQQICPLGKPLCLWGKSSKCGDGEDAARVETAKAEGAATDVTGIFACTKRSDCGTQQCCTGALGPQRTFCANRCDLANNLVVCEKDVDCASVNAAYCPGRAARSVASSRAGRAGGCHLG